MPNKEVLLAYYYEDRIMVADTAKLNSQGVGHFKKSTKKLGTGQYILFFNPGNVFELIIGGDQNFSITTDTTDVLNNIVYEGSPENTAFLDFQKFMGNINKKSAQIGEEFQKDPNKDEDNVKRAYQAMFEDMDKEIKAYVKGITTNFPHSAVATFANFTVSPSTPDFSKTVPEGTKDRDIEIRKKAYLYAKQHFWDNTNFTDTTLIRTNLFKKKLDNYFENMVVVHPDSLFNACDEILIKARPQKTMFRYLLNYCLMSTFDNKIMGMDGAFVKLGEKYYMSGIVDWMNPTELKKITDEVLKRQYNQIGHTAIDLQLPTIDGQVTSLYDTKAPFTLLLFWEPNCGHCKKVVPQVKKDIYNKFAPHGLKVFAVNTTTNKKEWEDFVVKNETFDFINVWDPSRGSNYWTIYNVFSTPVMYVLDKDKKIIAKNLAVEQMVDLLKNEYKKQGTTIE
jgi:peroxiredoxin